MLLVLH